MLKQREVEKCISNSETIVTDCVCSWKKSVLMNKCTSPHLQKILPTERKSVWIVTICSGIWGTHMGLLSAKLKSLGETGREGRCVPMQFNIFASSSHNGCVLGSGHSQHPSLGTNMNPHSLQIAAFGLTVAVVQSCTEDWGLRQRLPAQDGVSGCTPAPSCPALSTGAASTLCATTWITHDPQLPWKFGPLSQHASSC